MSKNDVLGAVTVRETKGVVADLLDKLGGGSGRDWLERTKRFLRMENPWPGQPGRVIPVWTILQMQRKDKEELIGNFPSAGVLHDGARQMMLEDRELTARGPLVLVKLRLPDLGYKKSVTILEVMGRAFGIGYHACPIETGAHLRIAYRDQPKDEHVVIMSPPVDLGDIPHLFCVSRNVAGRWLTQRSAKIPVRMDEDLIFALNAIP